MNYMQLEAGIHLVIGGKPFTIAKSDALYEEVISLVKGGGSEEDVKAVIDRNEILVKKAASLTPDMSIENGLVLFKGVALDPTLSSRILQAAEEGFSLEPFNNFCENLLQNPAFRVVKHLYEFLEKGKNAITSDGHFLAYKAVRHDFKDIYSGKMDNSVGMTVSIPRNQVDENPQQTCSHGLHVCSHDYLPHFAHANGHVVVCKVNPADVVAIPADYNNTKMRVCSYLVVGEYEDYYATERSNILAAAAVMDYDSDNVYSFDEDGEYCLDCDRYPCECDEEDDTPVISAFHNFILEGKVSERFQVIKAYAVLSDAIAALNTVADEYESARVRNKVTGSIIQEVVRDSSVFELCACVGQELVVVETSENVMDAIISAASLLDEEDYSVIFIRDGKGNIVKTISG